MAHWRIEARDISKIQFEFIYVHMGVARAQFHLITVVKIYNEDVKYKSGDQSF